MNSPTDEQFDNNFRLASASSAYWKERSLALNVLHVSHWCIGIGLLTGISIKIIHNRFRCKICSFQIDTREWQFSIAESAKSFDRTYFNVRTSSLTRKCKLYSWAVISCWVQPQKSKSIEEIYLFYRWFTFQILQIERWRSRWSYYHRSHTRHFEVFQTSIMHYSTCHCRTTK